jgi:ubiquinone/menaquinone biosynthesis C-methylase UbiE
LTPYDPTLFEGSAAHYRYGRPPYSPQLEAVLTEELGLDGSGRLLDGGCGPGILTIRLAQLFDDVVGLDPDAAMLAEGRRVADERGIAKIRWVHARAEELPEAAPGPYRLVTFGQSLHWTAEPGTAADPARRAQRAGGEVPRFDASRGPGRRGRADTPLRGRPGAQPVRCAAVDLRPRHP